MLFCVGRRFVGEHFFRFVDVLVDEVDLAAVLGKEVVLEAVSAANYHALVFSELDEPQESYLFVKLADLRPESPLPVFAVLHRGFFVHQPLQNFFADFALLVEKGEELVPGDGVLDERLRDAALDVGRSAPLEGGNKLRNCFDGQLLLGIPVYEPRFLETLVNGQQVVRRQIQWMEGIFQHDLTILKHHSLLYNHHAHSPTAIEQTWSCKCGMKKGLSELFGYFILKGVEFGV